MQQEKQLLTIFGQIRVPKWETLIVLADTSEGVLGVMYAMIPTDAALLWFSDGNALAHNLDSSIGKILDEQELRDIFVAISRQNH